MRVLTLLLLLASQPGRAIELELEQNRAQRGNIGYVDMQKLFKQYPETIRAKETFEDAVRQAEEQLNFRKTELMKLRAELVQMKFERDALSKGKLPPPAPIEPAQPAPVEPPKAEVSTTTIFSVDATTNPLAEGATAPLIANLPGLTADGDAKDAKGSRKKDKKKLANYTETAPSPSVQPVIPTAELAALDGKIARLEVTIAQHEVVLKDRQTSAEKNLLELESRRSEILLGKIHKAVKEIARREGISVVVDKGSILYGQDAVDLTERVLKLLKGA